MMNFLNTINFSEALDQGQKAVQCAIQSCQDIDNLFKKISGQLNEVTNGKLELARREMERDGWTLAIDACASQTHTTSTSKKAWFMVVRNPSAENTAWVKLARWEQHEAGYPCVIHYCKEEVRCHNEEALAEAVAQLLASVWAGKKISHVLAHPLKDRS